MRPVLFGPSPETSMTRRSGVDAALAPPAQPAPTAVLDGTGQTFEDVEVARMAANDSAIATEEVA